MALTSAQMTDTRRYMGYQVVGTTTVIDGQHDLIYASFGMVTMSLYTRLTTLTADEESVLINTYLLNLVTLETAILGAAANLDTDEASVWKHNKNEIQDRERLFESWRLRMCAFIGFPAGRGIGSINSVNLVRA